VLHSKVTLKNLWALKEVQAYTNSWASFKQLVNFVVLVSTELVKLVRKGGWAPALVVVRVKPTLVRGPTALGVTEAKNVGTKLGVSEVTDVSRVVGELFFHVCSISPTEAGR
jgi:hypothetical protein